MNKKVKWVFNIVIKFGWKYIAVNAGLFLAMSLMTFVSNLLLKDVINELSFGISQGMLNKKFYILLILYFVVFFINASSGFLNMLGNNYYSFHMKSIFNTIFLYKSYDLEQVNFYDNKFVDKYSFIKGNINSISDYIGQLCEMVFSSGAGIVLAAILFLKYEPLLALFLVLDIGISYFVVGWISKKQYELGQRQIVSSRMADYYQGVLTDKKNAKELRMNHLQKFFYEKWQNYYQKKYQETLELGLENTKVFNRYLVVKLLLRFVMILIVLQGLYFKRYDIGAFVMLFSMINSVRQQVTSFASTLASGAYKNNEFLKQYYDFVQPMSMSEVKASLLLKTETYEKEEDFQSLELKNVSFSYPNSEKKVLDDISFSVQKGEFVCILGENGSGKTTLSKILNGSFLPGQGKVMLNDRFVEKDERSRLRKCFGNAPQEFSRFSLKAREFVGIGCLSEMENKEARWKAYKMADIQKKIEGWENKEDTILGKEYEESGVEMSGGEWQRFAVASAYMGEPQILLMDEPTASVDPLQEQKFMQNICKIRKDSDVTVVLISHRVGFARTADKIILLSDGKIAESGTHEELMKKQGIYTTMFEEQKKMYEEGEQ